MKKTYLIVLITASNSQDNRYRTVVATNPTNTFIIVFLRMYPLAPKQKGAVPKGTAS